MPKRKSALHLVDDSSQPKQVSNGCKMRIEDLITIDAMTETQGQFFSQYSSGAQAMLLHGLLVQERHILLFIRLEESMKNRGHQQVVLVRSAVPSRDIGYLPGDEVDKSEVYMAPYIVCAMNFSPQNKIHLVDW